MTDSHARFEELAAGHALAALEPGDEQAFLAHLPSCAACERAVAEHRETAAHLAYAVDPVELPDAILTGIRAGVQASGRAMPLPEEPEQAIDLDAARARRRPGTLPRSWMGVAAAAVLVLALGTWNASLQQSRTDADQRADRLAAAVKLLETPNRVALSDTSGRPVAFAVMHDDRRMSLVVDGLAPNDRGSSTYVLWQIGITGPTAIGTFDVREQSADIVGQMALSAGSRPTALAVTKEPGRSAPPAPGSPPVANGPIPA